MIGSPSRRSRSDWKALPEIREWSEVSPGGPGVVGRPSRRSESIQKPFWRSGSSREVLPEVRDYSESLPEVREWSVSNPGGLGVVGRPS